MKRSKIKSVLFALGFAVLTGFVAAGATAAGPVPLEKSHSFYYDSSDSDGDGDDTTDGGIRYPGTGH